MIRGGKRNAGFLVCAFRRCDAKAKITDEDKATANWIKTPWIKTPPEKRF